MMANTHENLDHTNQLLTFIETINVIATQAILGQIDPLMAIMQIKELTQDAKSCVC